LWTESTVRWTDGALVSMVDHRRCGREVRWPLAGMRCVSARGHRWWPRGTRATRICWRGAHQSMSGDGEAVRQWQRRAVEASHRAGDIAEGRDQKHGGGVW
jgi:hypothetical protein